MKQNKVIAQKYEVKYQNRNQVKKLIVMAEDKKDAMQQVTSKVDGKIISVKLAKVSFGEDISKKASQLKSQLKSSEIKTEDLAVLYKQVSVMTGAGMSIVESIKEANTVTKDKVLKEIMDTCVVQIGSGKSFSESLIPFEQEIGRLSVSIISMAEKTGDISEALNYLIKILDEINQNKRKVKKALRQPIITIIFMMIAMATMIVLVVPKFESIFAKLGSDLPMATKALLFISDSLMDYGYLMVGSIFALFFLNKQLRRKSAKYLYETDKIKFKIPIMGAIIKYGLLARYLTVYNALNSAGISISDSLDTAFNTIDNEYMRSIMMPIPKKLEKGGDLPSIFKDTGLFGNMELKMMSSGEKTGEVDKMIEEVAIHYKNVFNDKVDNLTSAIEPIMLLLVAGMVLFLALGIFMPMWGLASATRGK